MRLPSGGGGGTCERVHQIWSVGGKGWKSLGLRYDTLCDVCFVCWEGATYDILPHTLPTSSFPVPFLNPAAAPLSTKGDPDRIVITAVDEIHVLRGDRRPIPPPPVPCCGTVRSVPTSTRRWEWIRHRHQSHDSQTPIVTPNDGPLPHHRHTLTL